MQKALFFDIDGTLYNFDGVMPASTKQALALAREKGHQLIICSGRATYQLYPQLLSDFDGIICTTGALVKKKDTVIFESFMPTGTIKSVLKLFNEIGGEVTALTENQMIFNEKSREYLINRFTRNGGEMDFVKQFMGDYIITEDLSAHRTIKKLLYHGARESVEYISAALCDICDVTASSFRNETDCGEITVKGINKSLGIQKYIESQGILLENTVAFGDGPNDLDMLEYAGVGVAMGNGSSALKGKADFVTKDINDDGIFFAMKSLELI